MASEGWGTAPARRAKSNVRAKAIGYGLAAAFSTTAILAVAHPQGFANSSWGGLLNTARDQISTFKVSKLTALATTPAKPMGSPEATTLARSGRLALSDTPWVPDGMARVAVGRSARLARAADSGAIGEVASLMPPAGLRDQSVGRSTRLALAEPTPAKALVRKLDAARTKAATVVPLPAVGPLVETASLEPKAAPVIRPAVPALPPQPPIQSSEQALALPTTPPQAPVDNAPQPMMAVPLPEMRPAELTQPAPVAVAADNGPQSAAEAVVAEAEPSDGINLPNTAPLPSFRPQREVQAEIQRTAPQPAQAPASPRYALAYASPETVKPETHSGGGLLSRIFGGGNRSRSLPGVGSGVAVYSIKDATVYLPDGTRLEAHSGMGQMTDKPRYVDEKMRGPTPPNIYNLTMRKQLFHGVEAVRMLPADGRNRYGRDGFLAHTYMLRGRPGESNGCVVFKNYQRFLHAFKAGKVERMVVVASLSDLPTMMASR